MRRFERAAEAQGFRAVVGVDAGKFEHALVVRARGQADAKPYRFRTTRAGFVAAAEQIRQSAAGAGPAEILVAIEFAGYYGFTFAHFLHAEGFPIVSVLPAHTKRYKDVVHGQPLKTDEKDAATIVALAAQGHYVRFPFLASSYAELRYLVSARERLSTQRRSTINRLKSLLQVVWPEFEGIFPNFGKATPLVLLEAFPTPDALVAAPRRRVLGVLRQASRGHHADATYAALLASAQATLALPGAQRTLGDELRLLCAQFALYEGQIATIEAAMVRAMAPLPEVPCLLSIPRVAPVTAAIFLGSVGDPQAYRSSREILKVAGLSLLKKQSGLQRGRDRISKRGRPVLRQHAYMLAVRSIREGGIFHAEYAGLLARGHATAKKKAVVAVSRSALKLLYAIARDRRTFAAIPPARPGAVMTGCP
jgi:transposase